MKIALLPAITADEREAERKSDELNRLVWITCRVCGMRSKVGLGNPALLCQPCRVDPLMTEAHVLHLRDALRERLYRAVVKWEAALANADEDARARWARVELARVAVASGEASETDFAATWKRARATGGAFAVLLLAWEEREEEAQLVNEGLERCAASLAEIAAYLDAARTQRGAGEGNG